VRCSAGFVASWLVGQTMRLGPIELPGLLNHVARDLPGRRGDDLVLPGLPRVPAGGAGRKTATTRDPATSSSTSRAMSTRRSARRSAGCSTSPSRLGRAVRDGEKRSTSICGRTGRRRQPVLPRSQRDQPRAVPRGAGAVQRRVPAPLNPHGRPAPVRKGRVPVPTLRQGSSRSSVSVRNSEGEMWNGGRSRSMQRRMLAPAALPSQESPVFCYALPTLTEEASRGGQASSYL
jgi:hypothetical protein